MIAWEESELLQRSRTLLADPYYEWCWATDFAYYGGGDFLPLLIELWGPSVAHGTAQEFALWVRGLQALGEHAPPWARELRVPAFYASPSKRMKGFTTFVSLLATRKFLQDLYDGNGPFDCIKRFEIGSPVASGAEPVAEDVLPPPWSGQTPEVVTAVIDDGMAFAHERFLSAGANGATGTTRIEYYWNQVVPMPFGWFYGYEISKAGIDQLMAQSRHAGLVDEDEVYRRSTDIDHSRQRHQPLALREAHGTHVMDLACCGLHKPAAGKRPILAVQLPVATVEDTSGATLAPQVCNGLLWAIDKADAIASRSGAAGVLPLVANVSYGLIAGPHDRSSLFETVMDQLTDVCGGSLRIVLPAGNNHLSRCHARFRLAARETRPLHWRVLPDDWTESYVDVWWLPGGGAALEVDVVAPGGLATTQIGTGQARKLVCDGRVVGLVLHYPAGALGPRALLRLWLAPTGSASGKGPFAPAGLWQLKCRNTHPSQAIEDLQAWIQRDDTAPGYRRRGRQSYFDDPAYARFDAGGRAIEKDSTASDVKREGTLNAIASGHETIVAAGFRRSDGAAAAYSASGPLVPPGRGAPSPNGPDAMLPCDDSPSQYGLLAAGTRSGCCVALNGSSVAAALATHWVAGQPAAVLPGRSALFAEAELKDPPGTVGKPLAIRGGGGRLPQPANRPHARREAPDWSA